jgi:uncharacterized protein (UPF0548 family)
MGHTREVLWSRAVPVLAVARDADLTYPEVGATGGSTLPGGYRHVHLVRTVGRGDAAFAAARDAVAGWQMHRGAGLRVAATTSTAQVGSTVVVGVGVGALRLLGPCRVVEVVDEPDRAGFAYGTLPGHPETGEERFEVTRRSEDVDLVVTAFSRPATWYSRLGGPVSRAVQDGVTRRYATAVERAVRAAVRTG